MSFTRFMFNVSLQKLRTLALSSATVLSLLIVLTLATDNLAWIRAGTSLTCSMPCRSGSRREIALALLSSVSSPMSSAIASGHPRATL